MKSFFVIICYGLIAWSDGLRQSLHMKQIFSAPQPPSGSLSLPSQVVRRAIPIAAYIGSNIMNRVSSNADDKPTYPENKADDTKYGLLGPDAYTTLGDLTVCKVINGMWQVSGAHGFSPDKAKAVAGMAKCADAGFTTFDAADIYGPAEEYIGSFRKGLLASSVAKDCQFFTKWVPRPMALNRAQAAAAIDKSLARMKTDRIDLLQFHWWDYDDLHYYDAADHLIHFQQMERIANLGLTNFDTKHMVDLIDQEMPVVSNQVSYSVLDTRPAVYMAEECEKKGVKLICYGALLGGFISPYWLNKPPPADEDSRVSVNVSLRKYLPWIYTWGSWELFQTLLNTLQAIATKHRVSLSHVAIRYVLQQPGVGGVTLGQRFGFSDHIQDNVKIFSFVLDTEDLDRIRAVQEKGKDKGQALMKRFGDCGGEYRRRRA